MFSQLGPYTVFPNVALWDKALDGMWGLPVIYPLFWICLVCQITIVIGCECLARSSTVSHAPRLTKCFSHADLWLFRKEQLNKP